MIPCAVKSLQYVRGSPGCAAWKPCSTRKQGDLCVREYAGEVVCFMNGTGCAAITGEIVPALRAKSYVTKVLKCLELINLCLCVCVYVLFFSPANGLSRD